MKYFSFTIIAIVTVAVAAGFFVVGSPQEARLLRFDERRVSDLQFLQSEIVNYWQSKEKLPPLLSALEDDLRGVKIPRDPETGKEYDYLVTAQTSFKLCAVFDRPSLKGTGAKPYESARPYPAAPFGLEQNWEHGAGFICFERTIDKDFYPPKKA